MNNLNQILAGHEERPPADVWDAIASHLDAEEASHAAFRSLARMDIAIPDKSIWEAITDSLPGREGQALRKITPTTHIAPANALPFFLKLPRAIVYMAAAMVIGAGIFWIVTLIQSKNADSLGPTEGLAIIEIPPAESIDNDTVGFIVDNLAGSDSGSLSPAPHRTPPSSQKNIPKITNAVKGEVEFALFEIEDEDEFFVALANYILPQKANEADRIKVNINQFASLYISGKMSLFMRGLYERNNNDRPTQTARRNYRKLRSWKKATEREFGNVRKNVENLSDPITLADFLHHNRRL